MFNLLTELVGAPLKVVELLGKAVETAGELADSETLKEVGKVISENAETIAK